MSSRLRGHARGGPFGASSAPLFDGEIGSWLTVASVPQYSQPFANAFAVAVWICPLALDNANKAGKAGEDQYVHFLEKAMTPDLDTEWAMRLYNQDNPTRHSRLSFYMFNLRATTTNPTNKGAGSYMEFGVSNNDVTPVTAGSWLFLVGEAEPWICADDQTTGCILWKQDIEAKCILQDKYEYPEFQVQPQRRLGAAQRRRNRGNRFQRRGRPSRHLEPPVIARRDRLDLDARRRRSRHNVNVAKLRLTGPLVKQL